MPQYSTYFGKWEDYITGEMTMAEWGFIQWGIYGGREIERF